MTSALRNFLIACGFLAAGSAFAQAPAPRAPYENDLNQLAEILGALHYLRPLCGANEPTQWRNEMQSILDSANLPPPQRDMVVNSFNRGYTAYEQTYRSCTPAATVAIRRYLEEGSKISRDLTARYAN